MLMKSSDFRFLFSGGGEYLYQMVDAKQDQQFDTSLFDIQVRNRIRVWLAISNEMLTDRVIFSAHGDLSEYVTHLDDRNISIHEIEKILHANLDKETIRV
ncbi:hypothetical protein Lepto7375DRAFT_0704 [Leptolyngbya sp. PCC 7375]|nr:hypothetical protein Lepto7375DRAFT_0704 [Leptolyngbya sp. PCC 7375]